MGNPACSVSLKTYVVRHILTGTGASVEANFTILEIGLLFAGLGLITWLCHRFKISSVPFFLITGLSLGKGGLAPLDVSENFLNIGAEIGAILLLLMLGLEYSVRELADSMRTRWQAGIFDLLLNAIPAALLAWVLGFGLVGAIAFGGIMFVSSSGIASQLIRESGWSKSHVSVRTTSVLVFEDILLAPYLPLVTAISLGLGVWAGVVCVSIALLVTAGVFWLGLGHGLPGLNRLETRRPDMLLLLVFGVTLVASAGSNLAGFSGAIAAFLVGLLLTGEVAETLRNRFAPLRDLFSAIFFLFFGLSISFIDVVAMLPIALAFAALGIAGKFVLGWWLGRDLSDKASWMRIGAFLTPRGEFSMLIAATVAGDALLASAREITLGVVVTTSVVATIAVRVLRSRFDR